MASNNGDFILDVHPLDGTNFIGAIRIEEVEESDSIETIIILDQSGSMGGQTARFTNMIIPLVLSILNYEQSKLVHLIAFQSSSTCFYKTAAQFKTLNISSGGGTNLAPALDHLKSLLKTFDGEQPIRILTISDGEVGDAARCEIVMKEITEILNRSHFSINSQAVRLFTSKNQPETKALCNLTMMNNTTTSSLVDMSCNESDEVTARTIANLFLSDKFKCTKSLKLGSRIVLKFPWNLEPASEIMLRPGLNLFWLKGIPTVAKIRNACVKVNKKNPLTLTKFQELMEVKMEYFLDHMKILKVVGTTEADNSVQKILKYFENQETALAKTCPNGQKKISVLLGDIARDENFKNLNSGQMAEYLRVLTQKHKEAAIKFQKEQEEQRRKEEEERRRIEAERIRQEEIRKKAQEEEQERIRQEEIRKKAQEEEQQRIRQEEIRKKAQEEEQERIRQEEIRKKAPEEEQQRIRQEELRMKAQEEEQERIRQEEIRKKAQEEEQQRIRQEELRMKAQEEEQERIRQEEIRKKEQEEEQERIRQGELRIKAQEEEQVRIRQEELQKKAQEEEQERIRQEELRMKAQEEEQERIRQEEIQNKEEDERYRKQLIEEEQCQKEELRENRLIANVSGRPIGYFYNYKFNFFIIIFIILFAIIELKLQLKSGTGCDL